MSVTNTFRKPGDLVSAADETALSLAIQIHSQDMASTELRSEALNRIHFQPTVGDVTTGSATQSSTSTTTGTYASSTYVPINHGTPMLLDFGPSGIEIEAGWVVRFQWSVYVNDYERAGNLGEYAFCLKTDIFGTGSFIQQSPDYWYSAMSYPRDGPSISTYWPMTRRRHTMSYTMISSTNYDLYQARVDVKIESPWTIDIVYDNLFAVVQRH